MTWIKVVPPDDAGPELRECYEAVKGLYPPEYHEDVPAARAPQGQTDSVVAAHSLIPEVLHHSFSAHARLLAPDLPLTRRQHEMISTVVSALNHCFY